MLFYIDGLSLNNVSLETFITPLKIMAENWGCSLAWFEHPADNREVTGPNPVSPIVIVSAGLLIPVKNV